MFQRSTDTSVRISRSLSMFPQETVAKLLENDTSLDAVGWVGLTTEMSEKKFGYEFGGLALIQGDLNLTNESLAILGLGKVPRLAS